MLPYFIPLDLVEFIKALSLLFLPFEQRLSD